MASTTWIHKYIYTKGSKSSSSWNRLGNTNTWGPILNINNPKWHPKLRACSYFRLPCSPLLQGTLASSSPSTWLTPKTRMPSDGLHSSHLRGKSPIKASPRSGDNLTNGKPECPCQVSSRSVNIYHWFSGLKLTSLTRTSTWEPTWTHPFISSKMAAPSTRFQWTSWLETVKQPILIKLCRSNLIPP